MPLLSLRFLPQVYHEIILWRDVEALRIREIASDLQLSTAVTKSHLHRLMILDVAIQFIEPLLFLLRRGKRGAKTVLGKLD